EQRAVHRAGGVGRRLSKGRTLVNGLARGESRAAGGAPTGSGAADVLHVLAHGAAVEAGDARDFFEGAVALVEERAVARGELAGLQGAGARGGEEAARFVGGGRLGDVRPAAAGEQHAAHALFELAHV